MRDDINIFGKDIREHNTALKKVLQLLHDLGLTINAKKCQLNKSEVNFCGYIFSKDGLSPDLVKVKALHDATTPHQCR